MKCLSFSYSVPGRVLDSNFNCAVQSHIAMPESQMGKGIYPLLQSFINADPRLTLLSKEPILGSFLIL